MTLRVKAAVLSVFTLFSHCLAADALDFFQPREVSAVTISPNGTHIALGRSRDGHAEVGILNAETGNRSVVFSGDQLLKGEESWVVDLKWIDDELIAVAITENRQAIANLVDTRTMRSMYIVDIASGDPGTDPTIYAIATSGFLVDAMPARSEQFLYAGSGNISRVFRVDARRLNLLGARRTKQTLVDGGQFNNTNEVGRFEGYVLRWFTDIQGNVRSALGIDRSRKLVLAGTTATDGDWETLASWDIGLGDPDDREGEDETGADPEQLLIPVAATASGDKFYAVQEENGQPDALYLFDPRSGDKSFIYSQVTAEIFGVLLDRKTQELTGIAVVDRGELRIEYLDDKTGPIIESLRPMLPGRRIALVDRDLGDRRFIIAAWSFSEPVEYFYWDAGQAELQLIADSMPNLETNDDIELISQSVDSHGLEIPYLLSMPGNDSGSFPLILLPHGGPIGLLDDRSFDPIAQYLLSRGFAVLQVNYRGSAGYSRDFLEAGKKEFGGKILDDIMAALDDALRRPDIDEGRVCIVGGSYGGYAAVSLGIRYPDKFRCMASISGVLDVNLTLTTARTSEGVREWQKEFIGDPEIEFQSLVEISPAYQAHRVQIPLLLAHGIDDVTVDVEHAYRMKFALDEAGLDYELHILEDTGHGFDDPVKAANFYQALADFVERNTTR